MEETIYRAVRLFAKAQEDNHYLYFELTFTHITEWMCFLIDKSKKTDDPDKRSTEGYLVLATGQSVDPVEAVHPVFTKLMSMGYDVE